MKLGKVTGSIWATKKVPGLAGHGLLTVTVDGDRMVAADFVGAGQGDRVLLLTGGAARMGDPKLPIDAAIIGILDEEDANVCQ